MRDVTSLVTRPPFPSFTMSITKPSVRLLLLRDQQPLPRCQDYRKSNDSDLSAIPLLGFETTRNDVVSPHQRAVSFSHQLHAAPANGARGASFDSFVPGLSLTCSGWNTTPTLDEQSCTQYKRLIFNMPTTPARPVAKAGQQRAGLRC